MVAAGLRASGFACGPLHGPAALGSIFIKLVWVNIAHREPIGHALLKVTQHLGVCLRHEYRDRSSIPGKELSDEIAVLRAVDVDHCGHGTTSLVSRATIAHRLPNARD